ncbi:cell division protein FtsX [Paenibacillus sp. y28]|uniref:cell division protein FtsX n=1 Tax=Paenibacillus sp. y28 TaxID=3129110 RepID=UPI003018099E
MRLANYIWRDACDGIRRNRAAALAASALIFAAMTLAGVLLMVRAGANDILLYLQAQVSMKVYVDPAVNTGEVARILQGNRFVQTAAVETKEQQLERLSLFFQGREQLLAGFQSSDMPDAIRLELVKGADAALFAEELRTVRGITEIIYPQQLAEALLFWSGGISRYGLLLLLFFASLSFLTAVLAISLAMKQRQKEIRIKLLLGAKPAHIRAQFVLEGGLMGGIGSLCASLAVYALYVSVLERLSRQLHGILHISAAGLYGLLLGLLVTGTAIGVAAGYFCTGKLMKHA